MHDEAEVASTAATLRLVVRTRACLKKWDKESRKSKKRYYTLKELVETECKYLADLTLIIQKVQQPLREGNFISEYEQREMFPNFQGMLQLSRSIHQDMAALLAGWNRKSTLIGPTMIRYSKFMLVYSDFFKNKKKTEERLKLLLENQEVQQIEKRIVEPPKFQTFHNLISKPFQRPLKYHLILKGYAEETAATHPDYKSLHEAIACYHEVNQRNNKAMEHKEKDQMLMHLDGLFKNIINSEARYFITDFRYFITESSAFVFSQKVRCFLLSDLMLISREQGQSQKEYARIYLNEDSFAVPLRNGAHLKNGLLVCGKKNCVYLTFLEPTERNHLYKYLNRIITDSYRNKHYKEERRRSTFDEVRTSNFQDHRSTHSNLLRSYSMDKVRDSARSTMDEVQGQHSPTPEDAHSSYSQTEDESQGRRISSVNESRARTSSVSSLSFRETAVQDLRISITNKSNTLARPPRIVVLGPIKRSYSSKVVKIYYLTRFQQPYPSSHNQLLYIDQDDMDSIQKIVSAIYHKLTDFLEMPCFEELAKLRAEFDLRSMEYKCVYYTLLLNSLFRHPQIAKRTDIFMQKMDVSDGLWALIRFQGFECRCPSCLEGVVVSDIQKYKQQLKSRQEARQNPLTFYCPFRTFRMLQTAAAMQAQKVRALNSPYDRVFWIKSIKRGELQYRLLDSPPGDMGQSKQVLFHLCCGLEDKKYQRQVKRHDRVGQIKCTLGKELNIDLSQYQMYMEINKVGWLLGDDEVLFKLLANEVPPEQGLAGFFKSTFGTKEETAIKIYLKRVWWFLSPEIEGSFTQKIETKVNLFIQDIAFRIKNQEIMLSVSDTITFYACYFIYLENVKGEDHITLELLGRLVPPRKWKILSSSNKEEQLNLTRKKFKTLSEKTFASLQGAALKKKLFEYLAKQLKNKPIWGIYIFQALYLNDGKSTPVRIGFDFTSFVVKESERVTNILEYKVSEIRDKLQISSWQLRIVQEQKEEVFVGGCFVQMLEMLEMFAQYEKSFLQLQPA